DLFVVGDPNQSVYGWNGADPGLLTRITREFEGTRVLHLRENHRCSPQVVRLAAAALGMHGSSAPASTRQDGRVPTLACLSTDDEEARWVARQVWLAHRPGRRWSSIAVLARTNAQLARVAEALGRERVPYRAAGGDVAPASDLAQGDEADDAPGGVGGGVGADDDDGRAVDERGMDERGMGERAGAADVGESTNAVVLSTFHRAKGLQWAAVFVIGLSDGLVPLVTARSAAARAEEQRLLYVALTRAEDELACSWARHADDTATAQDTARRPSPWLAAMESTVSDLRAATSPGATTAAEHLASIRARIATTPTSTPARVPR
ncbi:MAG: 3'-5' exonuclease, partial [Acidimicrobiales bacterium]